VRSPSSVEAERSESDVGQADVESADLLLSQAVAWAIPLAGFVGGGVASWVGGVGPALLMLAGTALLGTVLLLWTSVRMLSGDASFPVSVSAGVSGAGAGAPERKRQALRALKDLEFEHLVGKIDDADYLELSARYRTVAKDLMREMDAGLEPRRERAERIIEAHLKCQRRDAAETTDGSC
jgi:hypothetical protein